MRPKVPLVEGELECSTTLAVAFEGSDAPPFQHASTAEQALATFRLRLITDINPPTGRAGIDPPSPAPAPHAGAADRCHDPVDANPATHERALQLGANAFTSPIPPFALGQKIEELIREI